MPGKLERGDPQEIIDSSAMNPRQWLVVVIMVILNALDGFDVLSSAFAAPGISAEWGISRASLGVVLSAELVGMGVGSIILGSLADKSGRKFTILVCLALMAAGMYGASAAQSVNGLTFYRLVTGIGIGGMLAATNAMTAETTNVRWRSVCIAAYVGGYPIGAVLGGLATQSWLLVAFDWRAVFVFGAILTAAMIPVVWFAVPESASFHAKRADPKALARVNRIMAAFAKPLLVSLRAPVSEASKSGISDLFVDPYLRKVTVLLTLGYTLHTLTFYFVLKWAVQIVSDYPPGYPPAQAASVLTMTSLGGAIGCLGFGLALSRFGMKWPVTAVLVLTTLTTIVFGLGHDSLAGWQIVAFCFGVVSNAAIVGFYKAFADYFPSRVRATGTGVAIGLGRAGAASSPLIAGVLFQTLGKDQLLLVAALIGLASTIAAVLFVSLPSAQSKPEAR